MGEPDNFCGKPDENNTFLRLSPAYPEINLLMLPGPMMKTGAYYCINTRWWQGGGSMLYKQNASSIDEPDKHIYIYNCIDDMIHGASRLIEPA